MGQEVGDDGEEERAAGRPGQAADDCVARRVSSPLHLSHEPLLPARAGPLDRTRQGPQLLICVQRLVLVFSYLANHSSVFTVLLIK